MGWNRRAGGGGGFQLAEMKQGAPQRDEGFGANHVGVVPVQRSHRGGAGLGLLLARMRCVYAQLAQAHEQLVGAQIPVVALRTLREHKGLRFVEHIEQLVLGSARERPVSRRHARRLALSTGVSGARYRVCVVYWYSFSSPQSSTFKPEEHQQVCAPHVRRHAVVVNLLPPLPHDITHILVSARHQAATRGDAFRGHLLVVLSAATRKTSQRGSLHT